MTDREILAQCTLEEKASLCSGRDFWTLKGIARLGLEPVMVTDGPHGLRKQAGSNDHLGINQSVKATCFPAACATACSFDPSLVYKIGEAMGEECLQEEVAVILGPGANIKRSPLCGRNFEYFSEDPYLTGKLAAALIEGVQSKGVGTSLKHYAVNNQETARMVSDSVVDERALREIYLAAFEEAVKKARPWTVMCSYNLLNGVYVSGNKKLLTDILRSEWGFSGLVLSDWGATVDRAPDLAAGLDLEMPGSGGYGDAKIVEAVREGTLDEALLDAAALRIIQLILRARSAREPAAACRYDAAAHHALARKAAAESAVLLKNDPALLPLAPGKSLAVIGAFARTPRYQGAGSSKINPLTLDSPFEALMAAGLNPVYAAGYPTGPGTGEEDALIREAAELAAAKDIALVFAGLPDEYESEGFDRDRLDMPASHNKLIEAVAKANPNTIVVLQLGAPVLLPWRDRVGAILAAYLGGEAAGGALADMLTGAVNPSGKLAESWPLALEDTPAYRNFGGRTVEYRESIFVGYRYYDTAGKKTAFPFGYGLSYTAFQYDNLTAIPADDGRPNCFSVTCTVTNTGSRPGAEVLQLYTAKKESLLFRAAKELKGFEKVFLEPGETRKAVFVLEESAFRYYNTAAHGWAVEGGTYEILVGASSADIRLRAAVTVTGDGKEAALAALQKSAAPYFKLRDGGIPGEGAAFEALLGQRPGKKPAAAFSVNSTLSEIRAAPGGEALISRLTRETGTVFGGDTPSDMQRMFDAMLADMPLRTLALFSSGRLSPQMIEETVAALNGKGAKSK
ncbi:MAG: glycoside hydrolase family 3 C-terminal domain-containing protein [Spirochaetaceae bacterium]|jgi:beta-glucosidase|nr:glycoside hydrolase family 3 C-terminal domain-containing protein [Spirochaetaceae bacterium]